MRKVFIRYQSTWMDPAAIRLYAKQPLKKRREERETLLNLINELQETHKIFKSEHILNPTPTPKGILNMMNAILMEAIREPLDSVAVVDKEFAKMLCYAFFKQQKNENNDEFWQNTKQPLYSLLVAAYVSNSMSHIYSEQKEFAINHEYFEMSALNLFDEIYLANKKKLEYHVLAYNYEEVFRVENKGVYISNEGEIIPLNDKWERKWKKKVWRKPSRELLCVAYLGHCMKFISHPACQNYIQMRWAGENVKKLFSPGNKKTEEEEEIKREENSKFRKIGLIFSTRFWLSPLSKFIIHVGFQLFYLLLFAIVLLNKPWRKTMTKTGGKYYIIHITYDKNTILFFYVIITLLCEMLNQSHKTLVTIAWRGAVWFWWLHPIWSKVRTTFEYILFILIYLLFIFFIVMFTSYPDIRVYYLFSPMTAVMLSLFETFLTIYFVISTITTLKFLSIMEYFGPKLQLIENMAYSIIKYMPILIIFWVMYAICHLSLTEEGESNIETILWKIFQSGAFEIFGELKDVDRVGEIQNCSEIVLETTNVTHVERWRCIFQSKLTSVFLFLYMMTATIILINIFTAMLSHEYEKINEMASYYSKFYRYEMLARFETKKFLPRPLNLIYVPRWFIITIINCLANCRSIYCSCYCCAGCLEKKPLKYLIRWFTFSSVKKWGSGPKGVDVNKVEVEKLVKKVLSERTSHNFLEAVLKYVNKEKAERSSRVRYTEDLQEAKEIFNGLMNQYTTFLASQTAKIEQKNGQSTNTTVLDESQPRNSSGIELGQGDDRSRNSSGNINRAEIAITLHS